MAVSPYLSSSSDPLDAQLRNAEAAIRAYRDHGGRTPSGFPKPLSYYQGVYAETQRALARRAPAQRALSQRESGNGDPLGDPADTGERVVRDAPATTPQTPPMAPLHPAGPLSDTERLFVDRYNHGIAPARNAGRPVPPARTLAPGVKPPHGGDPYLAAGLRFSKEAYQDGVNDPARGVDLAGGGNIPFFEALADVAHAKVKGVFRGAKTPSQVEQAQTDALSPSADLGRTVGFRGATDANTPRGGWQTNRLQNHRFDPKTGEPMTESYYVRKGVADATRQGSALLLKAGLPAWLADGLSATATFPADVGADLRTASDPNETMDHVYGAAANVSGKLAGELAAGPLLHKIGEIAGPLVGPVAGRVVGALKRTRAWGLVAKAESREAAAGVLRRAGGGPEAVERTLGAIEDSGENVRWKGTSPRSTATAGEEPLSQGGRRGTKSVWTTTDGRNLEAPNIPWKYAYEYPTRTGKMVRFGDVPAVTDSTGHVIVNEALKRSAKEWGIDEPGTDPRLKWVDENVVIPLLLHEQGHVWFSPKLFLTKLRGYVGEWAYDNSHLIRYLEESFAQSNVTGLRHGFDYPLSPEALTEYKLSPDQIIREAKIYGAVTGVGMGAAYLKGKSDVESSHGHRH